MSRAWSMVALLCCALLGHATALRAQEPEPPPSAISHPVGAAEQQARAEFEQGVAESAAGDWARACASFRRSLTSVERPTTLFNLSLALLHTGQAREALQRMQRFEELSGESVSAEQRASLERMRRRARALLTTLRLRVAPPQAALEIDGVALDGSGTERTLQLERGPHMLRLSADGYVPQQRALDVAPTPAGSGDPEHAIELAPLPAETARVADTRGPQLQKVLASTPASAPPTRDEPKPLVRRWWFWTATGVAVAALAVGAGLLATRFGERGDSGRASNAIVYQIEGAP